MLFGEGAGPAVSPCFLSLNLGNCHKSLSQRVTCGHVSGTELYISTLRKKLKTTNPMTLSYSTTYSCSCQSDPRSSSRTRTVMMVRLTVAWEAVVLVEESCQEHRSTFLSPFSSAFPPSNPGSDNDGAALLSHSAPTAAWPWLIRSCSLIRRLINSMVPPPLPWNTFAWDKSPDPHDCQRGWDRFRLHGWKYCYYEEAKYRTMSSKRAI